MNTEVHTPISNVFSNLLVRPTSPSLSGIVHGIPVAGPEVSGPASKEKDFRQEVLSEESCLLRFQELNGRGVPSA